MNTARTAPGSSRPPLASKPKAQPVPPAVASYRWPEGSATAERELARAADLERLLMKQSLPPEYFLG